MSTYAEQLERRALDALVEMLMDGKRYPSRTDRFGITLVSVLNDVDQSELIDLLLEIIAQPQDAKNNVSDFVAKEIGGSEWHVQLTETMREDDEAAARESAMESKRERMEQ